MILKRSPRRVAALLLSCAALTLPTAAHAGFFSTLNKVANAIKKEADKNAQNGTPQTAAGQQPAASGQQASSTAQHAASVTPAAGGGNDIWHAIPLAPKSGTPEGTAALLKEMPDISVSEFKLGMPADDAIAKMKALGYKNVPGNSGNFYFKVRQVPDQTYLGGAAGSKGNEQLRLDFTMYPNKPVVSGITRMLPIDPATAPTVNTMLAALRDKYGPESFKEGHQLYIYWFYDHAGHPLSATQYKELQRLGCAGDHLNTGSGNRFAIGSPDLQAKKVTQGYQMSSLKYHSSDTEPCFDVIAVQASLDAQDPHTHATADVDYGGGWDKIGGNIVTYVTVTASNEALDFSASTVSHNLAIHYDEMQRQKQEEAAKTHKAPSL